MLTSRQESLDLSHEQKIYLVLGRGLGGPGAREHLDFWLRTRWDLFWLRHL